MSSRIRSGIAVGVAALAVAGGAVTTSASAGITTDHLTTGHPSTGHPSTGHPSTGHPSTGDATTDRTTAGDRDLVRFRHVSVDAGLSPGRARLVLQRVRELYTFWDTGDVAYLHRADSPGFVDHTLPAGRPQGLAGIAQASRTFRTAVPDLHCTVADVLVSGDRVSVRQVYTGHFTGTYDGVRGRGQAVRFDAFDIQQVGRTQIVADWHLEDNLTFLQQIGVR